MKTNRRDFLMSAALAGSALALVSGCAAQGARPAKTNYATLDRVLQQPVLKRGLFSSPVMIESVELLRDRDNFICRVRSQDGAEGLSIGHPFIARHSYPIFVNRLAPFFVGKDARDLDQLIYMLQMVSVCPAAAKYHEFKMFQTADANGTMIPVESKAEKFESINGVIKVPFGSGLGVRIDPDYIKTHTRFMG